MEETEFRKTGTASNLIPYPLRFMSKKERERLARDTQICQEYVQMRRQYPKLSRRRIVDSIAQKTECSWSRIYQLLNRAEVW